jgi:hypothetical protein
MACPGEIRAFHPARFADPEEIVQSMAPVSGKPRLKGTREAEGSGRHEPAVA